MTADPGVSHPTMTRIAAFILVGVLLLLIVGPIALFMLAGVRDTVEATPHAMASEPPAAQPATIEEAAWWRLSFDQLNQGPSVDVGTLGAGRTANGSRSAPSSAAAP